MTDPIASAYSRLDWSLKHIEDFRLAVRAFIKGGSHYVVTKEYPERGQVEYWLEMEGPFPETLGLIAGDSIHNLRATLDGLFKALAENHGIKDDVGFPLRQSPQGFTDTRKGLPKIPDPIWDALEDFQPYKRGKALRVLHDLDIVNKHRTILLTASNPLEFRVKSPDAVYMIVCEGPIEHRSIFAKVFFTPRDRAPHIQGNSALDVCFNEPGDINGKFVHPFLLHMENLIRSEVAPVFKPWLT